MSSIDSIRNRSRQWSYWRAAVCYLVIFLWMTASASAAPESGKLVGRRAPEFIRQDLHGETIDLARYRGRVVLLNFWSTWCAPCQTELPRFDQWQSDLHAQGFQVVAVAMDDNLPLVHRIVTRLHLALPVVIGDAKLGDLYGGIFGFPVTFLIDRSGTIRQQFEGETDPRQLEAAVRALLSAPPR